MSFRCPMLAILQGVNGFLLYKQYKNFVSSVACFYH